MKPEQQLHVSVADYLRAVLDAGVFWTTIAHGGYRLPIWLAVLLKRMGLRKGTPDILLVHQGRALFIELKALNGKLKPDQIDAHYAILKAGGHVATCKSIEEVRDWLVKWKVPMRERIAA